MSKKKQNDKTETTPLPVTPETTTPAVAAQTWDRTQYDPALYMDGRDGFSSVPSADQLLARPLAKCVDGKWTDHAGVEIPNDRPLIAVATIAFVRGYLADKSPPTDYTVHPLPHPKVLNAQVPKPWRLSFGKEEEPFALYKGVLLYDEHTGQTILWANKTDGAMAAVAELQEAVAGHRFTSGGKEVPVVLLSSVTWPTGYGPKIRPVLKLTGEWRMPPTGPQPAAPQIAAQPAPATDDDDADEGEASQGLTSKPCKPRDAAW